MMTACISPFAVTAVRKLQPYPNTTTTIWNGNMSISGILNNAFTSLEPSFVSYNEVSSGALQVRIVSKKYEHLNIPERVSLLYWLLMESCPDLLRNYAIAFDVLTPDELEELTTEEAENGKETGKYEFTKEFEDLCK